MKNVSKDKKDCAERIRQIRMSCGYSQEQMADIFEISLPAYKKIESAENNITLRGLKALKDKLGVSADYIIFGDESNTDDVWKAFNDCDENEKMKFFLEFMVYNACSESNYRALALSKKIVKKIIRETKDEIDNSKCH